MPYIAKFLNSSEADKTNQRLERNRKIAALDKESQYLNDEAFEKKYGPTKNSMKLVSTTEIFLVKLLFNRTYAKSDHFVAALSVFVFP